MNCLLHKDLGYDVATSSTEELIYFSLSGFAREATEKSHAAPWTRGIGEHAAVCTDLRTGGVPVPCGCVG